MVVRAKDFVRDIPFIDNFRVVVRTIQRNELYRTRYSIWKDTVAKRPNNPRGHQALARILTERDEIDEAVARYQEALRCRKFGMLDENEDFPAIYYNSAVDLAMVFPLFD